MAQATPTPPAAFEPGGAVKLKLSDGGINLSGAQFMRLDKKVRAMLESADTDNDGNMSLDELSKVMEITLGNKFDPCGPRYDLCEAVIDLYTLESCSRDFVNLL